MDQGYCDLTEEEVDGLPLPDGWISLIKIPLSTSSALEQKPIRTYKNVRLGIESQEHPFMVQAQNKVKKSTVPERWIVKDINLSDGTKDYFYYNPELELSIWDHPLLRDELCEILNKAGHNAKTLGIKIEPKIVYQPDLHSVSSVRDTVISLKQPSVLSIATSNKTDTRSLSEHGSIKIRQNIQSQQTHSEQLVNNLAHSGHSERSSVGISEYDRSDDSISNAEEAESKSYNHLEEEGVEDEQDVSLMESEHSVDDQMEMLYMDELGEQSATVEEEEDSHYSHENLDFLPLPPVGEEILSEQVEENSYDNHHRDWESLLNTYKDPGSELDKISHRVQHIRPPVSISGIRVLREDVMEANERVHQLLMRLRCNLSTKSGIECSVLYHQDAIQSDTNTSPQKLIQNHVTLASDIVTALRQQPEFIILAMANSNNVRDGSEVMVQIAYTVLHRLLHPFSTDSSMTTAVLLQGINYQLDELTAVEQIFSVLDSKVIIARALFIADPELAVTWDPLDCPLPTIPGTQAETVLACLLRTYAIRRDVTSYYRSIWKPILPGVVALLKQHGSSSSDHNNNPPHNNIESQQSQSSKEHMFANTMAVAMRLLECTLNEKSIIIFPHIATAVCRAVHEIGGQLALHTYLFQLLILPNLLKVLAGDHDSTENEDIYRINNIQEIVNKYYDNSFWYKNPHKDKNSNKPYGNIEEDDKNPPEEMGILDPLRLLIWLIWRLYTCSIFMSDKTITAINMNIFINQATIPIKLNNYIDIYTYSKIKLRNMLTRLRRKIECGCLFLLKMPMDLQGSEYLGVNKINEEENLDLYIKKTSLSHEISSELMHLYDHRLHSLYFKPNEMLNLTIISKYELIALFSDIALAMEMHDQVEKTPIYTAIVEYLNNNHNSSSSSGNSTVEENKEELIELSFLYITDDFNGYNIDITTSSTNYTSSSNNEEKNSPNNTTTEHNEIITSRYNQLLRGLKLCNRYEDILIRMIQRSQNEQISNIFELIEDEFWLINTESHPINNNNNNLNNNNHHNHSNNIANKHTIGTINKKKTSHYGLVHSLPIPVFPLFSNSNATSTSRAVINTCHEIINHKSLKEIQKEIINSYRFHTSAPSANAGTSIARNKVLKPKINSNHINISNTTTTSNNNQNNSKNRRSNYTKIEINSNSAILAPTQSIINQNNPTQENPQQKHKKFLKSLRDHNIIPTEEFQKRYQKIILERKKRKKELQEQEQIASYTEHHHYSNNNNVVNPNTRVLQPFPEHLHNRVYGSTTTNTAAGVPSVQQLPRAHQYKQRGRMHSSTTTTAAAAVLRGRSRHRDNSPNASHNASQRQYEHSDDAYYSGTDTPQSLAQEIIRDYGNLFSPAAVDNQYASSNIGGNKQGRPEFMYTSMDSHHRAVSPGGSSRSGRRRTRSRSRSPGLPEPISPQSHFQAPTQALLHRLTDNSEQTLRDAHVLRRYENSSGLEIDEPFSPTANKFYPPQGLRVNRVPEFLYNDEISDYSRSMSRSHSRSNSFTSLSPLRGRSRDNSYSNLTHISRRPVEEDVSHQHQHQQQEYEYEEDEYLPIDEPETPIQSAPPQAAHRTLPNTVNVDFIQVRQQEDAHQQDAAVPNTYIQSSEALSALQKLRKVNITSVDLREAAARPAGGNLDSPATARRDLPPADKPYIAVLKPLNKRRNEPTSALNDGSMSAPQSVPPTTAATHSAEPPVLVIHSAAAAPLEGPAFVSSHEHYSAPASTSDIPTGSSVTQAIAPSKPEVIAHTTPATVPTGSTATNKTETIGKNNIPRPKTVTLKPTEPSHTTTNAASSVDVPDRPAVAYQYSIQFPSRSESNISSVTGAAAGTVAADSPAHVYDVNAAYEEAFERAYQRIHHGDDEAEDGEFTPEDDIQSLGYVDSSKNCNNSGKRGSFRTGLMSKAKSMSTRASKVFLDDQQLLVLLSEGFQAIKVSNIILCILYIYIYIKA